MGYSKTLKDMYGDTITVTNQSAHQEYVKIICYDGSSTTAMYLDLQGTSDLINSLKSARKQLKNKD